MIRGLAASVGAAVMLAAGGVACSYEEVPDPAPLTSISEWPAGIAGQTSGIHAVAAVEDTALAPYATLTIDSISIEVEGGVLRLSLTLPAGLLGYDLPLVFEGGQAHDLVELHNIETDAIARCEFGPTLFCTVQYAEISIDRASLEAYWKDAEPGAWAAHVEVAEAFAAAPTGTLDILLQR